mgnify:CR=1 FL=1
MRQFALCLALLLIQPPPPVLLSATFVTSTSAVVAWEQPAEMTHGITCLRIIHVGATDAAGICWRDLEAGPVRVDLPGIYAAQWYTPQISDRFILAFGMDDVGSAVLGEAVVYRTYLPLATKSTPAMRALYLPAIRF